MKKKGLVYLFEGDGKGKTSAALGVALRTLLNGGKVVWISWFKSEKWDITEKRFPEYFHKSLKMYWTGEGFLIRKGERKRIGGKVIRMAKTNRSFVTDMASIKEHKIAAVKALEIARNCLEMKIKPDLLVLDEVVRAVSEELITGRELIETVRLRGSTHVVMTGHTATKGIKKVADLITEMKKEKHPYDKGVLAVKGLDY